MSYNWKPGMKAVCVASGSNRWSSVVEGRVYDVLDVVPHSCGLLLDIGARNDGPPCGCRKCGAILSQAGVTLFYASRFRPLDELELTMDRLEKEGAPVEHELEPA